MIRTRARLLINFNNQSRMYFVRRKCYTRLSKFLSNQPVSDAKMQGGEKWRREERGR